MRTKRAVTVRLTKLERAVVRAKAGERLAELELDAARAALGDTCTHPAKYVKPHVWEHDNGYGRQTMHTGAWCSLCLAYDLWKNGRWQSFAERMRQVERE